MPELYVDEAIMKLYELCAKYGKGIEEADKKVVELFEKGETRCCGLTFRVSQKPFRIEVS